jgi:spore coat protein U-like protein
MASTALIAKALLYPSNTLAGQTYGEGITFSKLSCGMSFALRPTGSPSVYAIPYQLKVLDQTVIKDVSIPWTPLSEGVNIQNILITGISPTIANASPDGSYKDTIVVTITVIE